MRTFLLGLGAALIVGAPSAFADDAPSYVLMGVSGVQAAVFVDTSTLQHRSQLVTAWELTVFSQPTEIGGRLASYTLNQEEFDCDRKTDRVVYLSGFGDNDELLLGASTSGTAAEPEIPESLSAVERQFVCGGSQPMPKVPASPSRHDAIKLAHDLLSEMARESAH